MYEKREITESTFTLIQKFSSVKVLPWIIFVIFVGVGVLVRLFLLDFSSSDIFVWKEAAECLLSGKNPYEITLISFEEPTIKNFYAYLPLWLYVCSAILFIFPENWFFILIKLLIIIFDLQVIVLLLYILSTKESNIWRTKLSILAWFLAPIVIMTGAMHGKFDSLMIVFLLLAGIFNKQKKFIPESIFLSLAILTKPIGLIFIPFFYRIEFKTKNIKKIGLKILTMGVPILLFSIPFLNKPLLYLMGALGVHITRSHDLAPLFSLLKLLFPSGNSESIIRMGLTIVIILSWLSLVILSIKREKEIYFWYFIVFVIFVFLYWVFLVQYSVWVYTFYVIVITNSKLKHWQAGSMTGGLLLFTTLVLFFLGLFVKQGA